MDDSGKVAKTRRFKSMVNKQKLMESLGEDQEEDPNQRKMSTNEGGNLNQTTYEPSENDITARSANGDMYKSVVSTKTKKTRAMSTMSTVSFDIPALP